MLIHLKITASKSLDATVTCWDILWRKGFLILPLMSPLIDALPLPYSLPEGNL